MNTAAQLRQKVHDAPPGTFFVARDYVGPGMSRAAVDLALSRLARDGLLVRARQGLYWKGRKSRFGPGRPRALDVALQVVGDDAGAGPSGWHASYVLGLSTQVPPVPELAIVGPAPTGVPGVTFRTRRNTKRTLLTSMEIALLEVLRDYPRTTEVGWDALVRRVRALGREVDVGRVVEVALHEKRPALRDRARRLLRDLNLTGSEHDEEPDDPTA